MRVVVIGASGNVGTSLLPLLLEEPAVSSVVAIARRIGEMPFDVEWQRADVATDELRPLFEDADALVHLAWAIQPSHDEETLWQTNVVGSKRVFEAAAESGVGTIVYASSVGAYSPGPKDPRVVESWPTDGTPTSFYARHKAVVEWLLDGLETAHPGIRVVRIRPSLIFKRPAATGVRRLFVGPLLPNRALQPGFLPAIPVNESLAFQAVHTDDVAIAFREALLREVSGAFNITAEPVLTLEDVAGALEARTVRVPLRLFHAGTHLSWRLRMQPTPVGWLDMGVETPLMSWERARRELGWHPVHTARQALGELLEGMAAGADFPTPPLARASSGKLRAREMIGATYPRTGHRPPQR